MKLKFQFKYISESLCLTDSTGKLLAFSIKTHDLDRFHDHAQAMRFKINHNTSWKRIQIKRLA